MKQLMTMHVKTKDSYGILGAITGEIGYNSFDHNLGGWPDTPGVFFGYDIDRGSVVLADRGLGILATLKRVKPELSSHKDALRTAFTEILSGRSPENRGNGLKFVYGLVIKYPIDLVFQTGDAVLTLGENQKSLNIKHSEEFVRGCLVSIKF